MVDRDNSSSFVAAFDKLICDDDSGTEDSTIYSSQEKQKVSMSMPGPESSQKHYRLLTVILAVLAVILLVVDIGLGVYYNQLTGGQQTLEDINREVAKLQAGYNAAIQGRMEAKKQLDRELSEQQHIKWELEHQTRRSKDYETQIKKKQDDISALKSHIPQLERGCRHCIPGWTFINNRCYYFAFSETHQVKTWDEARQFCKQWGGDLAVIDTAEKTVTITNLVMSKHDQLRSMHLSGFWIGLTDVEEEGNWKWVDGRRVVEAYWNNGEPNNQHNEDCGATYPRENPFKAWNDAPCSHKLKWICEMDPRNTS